MNLCASLLMIAMRPSKSRRSTWTASGKLYFSSQVSLWNRSASSHQKVTHLAKQQKFYDSIEFLRKFWQFYFGYSSSYNFVFFRWKIKVYCCSRWNPFFNCCLCMFVTAPLLLNKVWWKYEEFTIWAAKKVLHDHVQQTTFLLVERRGTKAHKWISFDGVWKNSTLKLKLYYLVIIRSYRKMACKYMSPLLTQRLLLITLHKIFSWRH